MKTENNSVVDGKLTDKLTDEELGKLHRKVDEIKKRSNEGSITFQDALDVIQYIIIENKSASHLGVIKGISEIKRIELIIATTPFDPVKFIGEGFTFWRGPKDGDGLNGEEDRDIRSAALVRVDFNKAEFLTCLEKDESSITGEEKLTCLKKAGCIRYGASVFMGLWEDYQACENKAESVLEKLYKQKGITYIDFFDVLHNPDGYRYVLYLFRSSDGQWRWGYRWLGDDWRGRSFSAVSQQV